MRFFVVVCIASCLVASGCDLFTEDTLSCVDDANCPDGYRCLEELCVEQTDEIVFGPPCPEGCAGDLVRDFDFTQGSSTGVWTYLDDVGDDTQYEMVLVDLEGVSTFVGYPPDPRATVLYCPTYKDEPACDGLETRILLTPSTYGGEGHMPTVAFTAPRDGDYEVTGSYVRTGGAADSPAVWLEARRDYSRNLLGSWRATPDVPEGDYSFTVSLLAGEKLWLTARGDGPGTPASLAIHEYVVDKNTFPGSCQLSLSFTGGSVVDVCGGVTYEHRAYDGDAYNPVASPITLAGPVNVLGDSLTFLEGQYLHATGGQAMDYSGDFTIQMWVRLPVFTWSTLYADWEDIALGGVQIGSSSGGFFGAYGLYDSGGGELGEVGVEWQWPDDNAWHFFRLVRDTSEGTFRACLDGELAAGVALDGALDLSPQQPPYIGRNVTYNPPYFAGDIDDVRVLKTALPCPD
jgi:hypothetical protein